MEPNQTAQQIDPSSTVGTGVPTQTPDSVAAVPNTVTPNPNPTNAPTTPMTVPPTVPMSGTSNTPTTPAPPPTPTPHEALYSKFLKMLNPPTRYVDPTGKLQEQPQTGRNIGNNVLAAVLSGMMTPTAYRQGAYGPVVDSQATAATAFAAGKQQKTEQNEQAQKLSDDMQARKLSTVKNNVDAMHLWAATSHEMGQDAQQQVDNYAPMLQIAQEHDQHLLPGDTKAVLATGMTMAEALKHPEFKDAMTKHSIVPDGVIQVPDDQGHLVPTQTFSVIDPNVRASMTQEAADIAGKINPAWKTAFEGSNGSMKMRLGQIQAITNQVNSVQYAERVFQDAAKSDDPAIKALGLKGDINGELMSAVRSGSRGSAQALKSLAIMENAKAAGGSTIDALDRLINDPDARAGSQYVLEALGTTADKVAKFVRDARLKQESELALAKVGGMGEKAPASQDQISKLVPTLGPSTDLTPDDSKALMADVPAPDKDGVIHMTQGQIEKLTARRDSVVTANKNVAERQALDLGDPTVMAKIANNVIEGDVNDVAKLASYRGNVRINAINAIHDEAARRGLDTTQFDEASLLNKTKTIDDFGGNKKGSTGAQIASFNALLGHTAGAVDAEKRLEGKTLGLTRQPVINMAMDAIGKQLTNDPDWTAYKTSLLPVQNEISNFLAAGYATREEDSRLMKTALDPHETPARITAVLRQLAETADVRLAEMGRRYLGTIGTTYPHLLSVDSANTLKRLNIASKSIPLSTTLPRGWQNGQATQMTDKNMARAYFQAANSDRAAAVALAKNNGWILQ